MDITGERFIPNAGMEEELEMEHMHRYCAVAPSVKGLNVLDAACGVGYGTKLLAAYAHSVIGVDIDMETVNYAIQHNSSDNITFKQMSIAELDFKNSSFDVVISFETIEHVDIDIQEKFLKKISELLKPDGFLVISTPDLDVFKQKTFGSYVNPFHIKEYNKADFEKLLKKFFPCVTMYTQENLHCSVIDGDGSAVFSKDERFSNGEYIIAVCSMQPKKLSLGGVYLPCTTDKRSTLLSSVYIDYGNGYNEDNKIVFNEYHKPNGDFSVVIAPENPKAIKSIRVDPCYFPAFVNISAHGDTGAEYVFTALNSVDQCDGKDVFVTGLSSYELTLESFADCFPMTIKGNIRKCRPDEIEQYKGIQVENVEEPVVTTAKPAPHSSFIYFNHGDGYSQNRFSEIIPDHETEDGRSVFRIEDNLANCVKCRFDPVINEMCLISDLQIKTNIGICSFLPLNGVKINGVIVFSNTNPQIEFELPSGTMWIEISAHIDTSCSFRYCEVFSAVQELPFIHNKVTQLEDSLSISNEHNTALLAQLEERNRVITDSNQNCSALMSQLDERNKVIDELRLQYDAVSEELIQRKAFSSELEAKITRLEGNIETYKSMYDQSVSHAEEYCVQINEMTKNLSLVKDERDNCIEQINKLQSRFDELLSELDTVAAERDSSMIRTKELGEDIRIVKEQLDIITDRHTEASEHIVSLENRINHLNAHINRVTQERNENLNQLNEMRNQINALNMQLQTVTNELNLMTNNYKTINGSRCWKITAPLRSVLDWLKRRRALQLSKKALGYLREYGFKATCSKVKSYLAKKRTHPVAVGMGRVSDFKSLNKFLRNIDSAEVYLGNIMQNYDSDNGKKILLVSHELDLTGAPVAILYFAEILREEGYCPVIISPKSGKLVDTVVSKNIPVLVLPGLYESNIINSFVDLFSHIVLNTIVTAPIISRLDNVDIPIFWWIHEAAASYTKQHIDNMPDFLPSNVTVATVGQYARNMLLHNRPCYNCEELLYFIPDNANSSVSNSSFTLPKQADNKVVFCLIGMLEHRKGQDIAVQAILNLTDEEIKSSYFVFVGRQCFEENYISIQNLCEQYPDNVLYTGEMRMEDVRELHKRMDCLICPSRDDPMPIVVTEALQLSKLVICSENTGSAAILTHENGGLVYTGDDHMLLRDCISKVIKNHNNMPEIKANARRIYDEYFSREVFRKNILEIIERPFSSTSNVSGNCLLPLESESLTMKRFVEEYHENCVEGDVITLEDALLEYDDDREAKKILLVTHECSRTGAPVALQFLAEAFAAEGAQVVIVSPFDGPMVKEQTAAGIPTIVYTKLYQDNFLRAQSKKFDMVVLSTVVTYRAVNQLADCGTPVLWWIHDSEASYRIGGFGNCMPEVVPDNVQVYCGGAYAQTQLLKYYPKYDTKLLYYMVPDQEIKSKEYPSYELKGSDGKFVFAVIGQQDYRKGHDVFAQAIKHLSDVEIKKSHFYFIGSHLDAEIKDAVDKICEEYPENVSYIPQVTRTELFSVYEQCDCVVCSSRDDPLPVFVTEAMMMGRTVICSEYTGWAPIIKEEDCGIVYHDNDSNELAQKMRYVLENNDKLDDMRIRGRQAYCKYFSENAFKNEAKSLLADFTVDREPLEWLTVSVVIPTYNAGPQFEELLKRLQKQKYIRNLEIVVIDSGSTDDTEKLCEEYNAVFEAISHEEFSHSYARNKGAMLAKGEIIIFMTQDALPLDENWAFNMIKPIIDCEAVAVSCRERCPEDTDLYYVAASWNHAGYQGIRDGDRLNVGASASPDELRQKAALNDVSNAIRSDIFKRYLYRFNYAEDLDLGLRILVGGYPLKLISSTETVHGHNRNAGYYLKRGFVESVALGKIYSGWKSPFESDGSVARKIVMGYSVINSAICWTHLETNGSEHIDDFFTTLLRNLEHFIKNVGGNEWRNEVNDPTVAAFIEKITPWSSISMNEEKELVHQIAYYVENVLRPFLKERQIDMLNSHFQNGIYECLRKQFCLAAGNLLSRLDMNSALYQEVKYLQEGV